MGLAHILTMIGLGKIRKSASEVGGEAFAWLPSSMTVAIRRSRWSHRTRTKIGQWGTGSGGVARSAPELGRVAGKRGGAGREAGAGTGGWKRQKRKAAGRVRIGERGRGIDHKRTRKKRIKMVEVSERGQRL